MAGNPLNSLLEYLKRAGNKYIDKDFANGYKE